MLAVLVLFLILCALLSKPCVHLHLLADNDYLSHSRTNFINGFFVVFVFIRHFSQYDIVPDSVERMAFHIMPAGQLLVTPFLFFSGYGLMCSMRRSRQSYTGKLMMTRFPKLWLHFALCIAVYWAVNTFLVGEQFTLCHSCLALLTWTSFGNSTWYIGIMLLAYLVLAICSFAMGKRGNIAVLVTSTLLLTICLLLINVYKASYWVNTALCIPAGMAYAVYRPSIDAFLRRIPIPSLLLGAVIMWLGCKTHRSWMGFDILGNIGAVLYAAGLCIVQGCISWKRPLPLMVWAGGPALFYLYILQRLPMLIGAYFGWNLEYREAYVAGCFVLTGILAFGVIPLFKKLDHVLFHS